EIAPAGESVTPDGKQPERTSKRYGGAPPPAVRGKVDETAIDGQQTETLAASSATLPASASARPDTLAPAPRVMRPCATIVPTNTVRAPRVTLPPTCQKTFQSWPPPITRTAVFGAPFSSPATRKIQTASASPAG